MYLRSVYLGSMFWHCRDRWCKVPASSQIAYMNVYTEVRRLLTLLRNGRIYQPSKGCNTGSLHYSGVDDHNPLSHWDVLRYLLNIGNKYCITHQTLTDYFMWTSCSLQTWAGCLIRCNIYSLLSEATEQKATMILFQHLEVNLTKSLDVFIWLQLPEHVGICCRRLW